VLPSRSSFDATAAVNMANPGLIVLDIEKMRRSGKPPSKNYVYFTGTRLPMTTRPTESLRPENLAKPLDRAQHLLLR
jgi:hypothetical protein